MNDPVNPIDRGEGSDPSPFSPVENPVDNQQPPMQANEQMGVQGSQLGQQYSQMHMRTMPGQQMQPGVLNPDEKTMGMLAHILGIFTFLGPLIIWLIKKDESQFVDYHGKEALNFQITMFIAYIASFFLLFILIGFLLLPILLILNILFPILAGIAANKGEYYKYPVSIRMIT